MQTNYESQYSEEGFWDKVKAYAKVAGAKVLEPALKMYYASQDTDTPAWAKTTIYGALGYFILPLDVIPDLMPAIGYSDDFGVLAAAAVAVASSVKPEHTEKAKKVLAEWLG